MAKLKSGTTIGGGIAWHSGNHGTGSTLDSDLLDGQHGTYYLDWTNVTNKPDPVITLAGDATGSVTLTDLGSGTLTVTVGNDSHSHTATFITDFDTEVANNSAVAANTAKVSNVTTNLSTTANGTSLTINSSDGDGASIPAATTSAWGAMTDEDKTKLNGIATGATANVGTVTSVSTTGTVNGITLSGTVTGSGTLTLGGTLGSIANSQLTNSSVTVGTTAIALGSSSTTLAGLTSVQTAKVVGTESTGATAKFEIVWNDTETSIDFNFV